MKQVKKHDNLTFSTDVLKQYNISFTSHNQGVHLVIKHGTQTIDFWPSTGKFIVRGGITGRGVNTLLLMLGIHKEDKP